jgi:transposase InsO family protein
VSRYQFIVSEKATYGVARLCRVLGVARSAWYAWTSGPSARAVADAALAEQIGAIHAHSRRTYGAPRIHAELRHGHGVRVGRKRVARLMRDAGLIGVSRRRRRGLTKPDKAATPAPDLLGRDFTATVPGSRLVGDITYLPTLEGWLYLASVVDLATRKLVGYAMAESQRAELVCDAIMMAAARTTLADQAVFHSDHGAQYTSAAFRQTLADLRVRQSMGRVGSCFDNAVAESFFATLKTEIGTRVWPTRAAARAAAFEFIEVFYNRQRRHSTIGYLTPHEAELRYRQQSPIAA